MAPSWFANYRPHFYMLLVQLGYTLLYITTDAGLKHGLNANVYVTYRHVISGIVMFPFAFYLESNKRPNMTLAIFGEIFVLSILGVSLTLNMYFESMKFTSATFVSAVVNTIACLTFIVAAILRLENVNVRNRRGMAKVVGTAVSLGGVTVMTLYKGPAIKTLWHPLIHLPVKSAGIHEDWVKGSILTIASCITWSISYIMQAYTLQRYPAPLSLTTWMSFVGAAQSAVFTAVVAPHPAWRVQMNVDFWATLYAGVVGSGMIVYAQLWATQVKGPVFVTMFNPLATILVAAAAYFVLGQKLYTGSILGSVIVIVGLYLLLWGKALDKTNDSQPPQAKEIELTNDSLVELEEEEEVNQLANQSEPDQILPA